MVNYYEELRLDRTQTLDGIKQQLAQLESVWKRREITNPDKATQMLALLVDARKIFESDSSRAEYDRLLSANTLKKPDESEIRRSSFNKWFNEALDYYDSKSYDLAKTALERAFNYIDSTTENSSVYDDAALIYYKNNEFSLAASYSNKAIVLQPTWSRPYLTKGVILLSQAYALNDEAARSDLIIAARKTLEEAIYKSRATNDLSVYGNALGILSLSLHQDKPKDVVRAEKMATEAIAIGETWGNAKKTLENINADKEQERRRSEEKAELERKRAEAEREKQKRIEEWNRQKRERERIEEEEKRKNNEKYQIFEKAMEIVDNSSYGADIHRYEKAIEMEMSRNVQSGNTQNLKSPAVPVRLPSAPAPTPGTSQAAVPAGCAYRS